MDNKVLISNFFLFFSRMVEILTGVAIVAVATIEEETVVTEVDHVVANEEVALEGEGQEEVVSEEHKTSNSLNAGLMKDMSSVGINDI